MLLRSKTADMVALAMAKRTSILDALALVLWTSLFATGLQLSFHQEDKSVPGVPAATLSRSPRTFLASLVMGFAFFLKCSEGGAEEQT